MCSVCVYIYTYYWDLNCVGSTFPTSCSSSRITQWQPAPQWCKSNWKNSNNINQMICFLFFFFSWRFLCSISHHVLRNPLQLTHQMQHREGHVMESVDGKFKLIPQLKVGLWNTALMAVIVINFILIWYIQRKFHIGYLMLTGQKSSQSVRVLIKCVGHCPIIRGVLWPQQWIMDPVIVGGL